MAVLTFYGKDQFSNGIDHFSETLQNISIQNGGNSKTLHNWLIFVIIGQRLYGSTSDEIFIIFYRPCETFQKFVAVYNENNHDSCVIIKMIEVKILLLILLCDV